MASMKKAALLIDGGFLRALCNLNGRSTNNPDYIEKVALACFDPALEEVFRIFYYDCAPFTGQVRRPVSNSMQSFSGNDAWQHELARKDFFALRRGRLKFAGWIPRAHAVSGQQLQDGDFRPEFEQKGVDMRIGLDIATLAAKHAVERILLLTGDTDFIPAMKHARTEGLQVVVVELPGVRFSQEFLEHVDIKRAVGWPP